MRFFKNLFRKGPPPVYEPVSMEENPVSTVENSIEEFEKKLLNMVVRDEWVMTVQPGSLCPSSIYQHASGITKFYLVNFGYVVQFPLN